METRGFIVRTIVSSFLVSVFILVGIFVASKLGLNWGKVEFLPASTITVTGDAKSEQKSETATYFVTVSAGNDDKQTAINEVNTKMNDILAKVKAFGVPDTDIKTQQVSIYESLEMEILTYPAPPRVAGKWQASNSLEVKLSDASKATAFTDLLNSTGATSVSGPNFGLTDVNESSDKLLEEAINDARQKAEKIAKASGRRLGKVITVSEAGYTGPIYPMAMEAKGRGGDVVATPIEPGTQEVYKSVTVVFELR